MVITMPICPKSSGNSNLARIMVLISPTPRLMIRKAKLHSPPLTILEISDEDTAMSTKGYATRKNLTWKNAAQNSYSHI